VREIRERRSGKGDGGRGRRRNGRKGSIMSEWEEEGER
jgi:hypothetical protein